MTEDFLVHRSRIEELVAGRTLIDALAQTAAKFADDAAYSDRHGEVGADGWRTLTWSETRQLALDVGAALMAAGVAVGDTVAIMSTNRIEHLLADMGAVHAAATPMSIYNTLSIDQVRFIAGESQPKVVIVETRDHLDRWAEALDGVGTVVVLDPAAKPDGELYVDWESFVASGKQFRATQGDELLARQEALKPDAPATILYTSGTTGNPKGVVLTHHNVIYEALSTLEASGLEPGLRQVSYLPLAHIAERVLSLYSPQVAGSHSYCISDPADLLATLGEVHPTAFFGVPRVWEKIKTGLSVKLAADPNPDNVKLVQDSMAAGLAWVQAQEVGGVMTPEIEAAYDEANSAILGFLKLLLGLDQVTWAGSAAAPMPIEVAKFMAGLGLMVFDVYGMTETCGAVTANGPSGFRLGTVGRPTPGMEVKLAEDNEVLVRGPVITPGYHRQDQATRNLIDSDGWVHTGDIGTLDEDGFFSIVDRKKELIITSAGKNIAPSNIENLLKESPIVGHAMAIGDSQAYIVAVLTLDGEVAPVLAQSLGIEFTDLADLSAKPQIRAMAQAAVDSANTRLSRPEQVKKWDLLPEEWTAESDELTPTLKLKRRVVSEKYADVVAALYAADA